MASCLQHNQNTEGPHSALGPSLSPGGPQLATCSGVERYGPLGAFIPTGSQAPWLPIVTLCVLRLRLPASRPISGQHLPGGRKTITRPQVPQSKMGQWAAGKHQLNLWRLARYLDQ